MTVLLEYFNKSVGTLMALDHMIYTLIIAHPGVMPSYN